MATKKTTAESELDFAMPDGFQPPEGAAPGESFDSVASFTWNKDDDTLCLTAIGGVPISEASAQKEDAAEGESPTAAPKSFKDAIMSGVSPAAAGAGGMRQ